MAKIEACDQEQHKQKIKKRWLNQTNSFHLATYRLSLGVKVRLNDKKSLIVKSVLIEIVMSAVHAKNIAQMILKKVGKNVSRLINNKVKVVLTRAQNLSLIVHKAKSHKVALISHHKLFQPLITTSATLTKRNKTAKNNMKTSTLSISAL